MIDTAPVAARATEPTDAFAPAPATAADRPPRRDTLGRLADAAGRFTARRPGTVARLGRGGMLAVLGLEGIAVIVATDQVVPATSAHQAELRIWLASRAAGIASLILLGAQIVIGLVLSHPTNKSTWRLSRLLFPWHDTLWLFVLAFVAAHVVSIVVDPYAGVGIAGALVPGLSSYRSAPVALGTLALDALVVTGITARWTRLLPAGAWLIVHRAALGIFVVAWMHGLLAGSDSMALLGLYLVLGAAVAGAATHRVWVVAAGRPEWRAA